MREDVKDMWVAALRDPNARQGHEVLRDPDGAMCCLGVLCEVAVKAGVIDPPELDPYTGEHGSFRYGDDDDNSHTYLPDAVKAWAQLSDADPAPPVRVDDETGPRPLSYLNDSLRWTFENIAAAIESSWETL